MPDLEPINPKSTYKSITENVIQESKKTPRLSSGQARKPLDLARGRQESRKTKAETETGKAKVEEIKKETEQKTEHFLLKKIKKWLEDSSNISITQKIFFIKNLNVMLKAGLSLGAALEALKQQMPNKRLKNILADVYTQVEKGQTFSDALKNYPKVFNELFVSMIASGEVSGNLEDVLEQLHHQLKRNHELISQVRGAMIYPSIVVTAMLGIGTGMIVFVMPKFISIFQDFQTQLPLPTRILIAMSNFIQANGIFVALFIIAFTVAFIKFIKTNLGKRWLHIFFLKAPVLGQIVHKINLAKFSRTVSSLIKTDIPIVKSFKITAQTLGNIYYKQALLESAEKIQKGTRINDVLREYPKLFPPVVTQMVTVGEESGSLDQVLSEMADFYEEEINQTMKNLPSIIEPILMLVLGTGVGFMAVSVLMPMYSLSQAI